MFYGLEILCCGAVYQLGAKGKEKKEKVVEAPLVEVQGLRGAS